VVADRLEGGRRRGALVRAADRSVDEAYEIVRGQGSLRSLLRSLADFPGVLSRRLDAEPSGDAADSAGRRA
jgi:hypothetical protein